MKFAKKFLISILTLESRFLLKKYRPFVIAVTGSVGKTSTKDAIYSAIKDHSAYVRKSQKSLNSEIGLPLTVIGVPNAWHSLSGWFRNVLEGLKLILFKAEYPNCLVLEIGADHPGDIKKVAAWLRPDIAVITRVSSTPVHVEFFKSPDQVFEEKAALAMAVKKGGTCILFSDEEKMLSLEPKLKEKGISVLTFGLNDKATIKGLNYQVQYEKGPVGFSFDITSEGAIAHISLKGIVGQTYMYPLIAAAAVAKVKGVSLSDSAKSISEFEAPPGRMNIIPGLNDSTLIDDTYNSSPDAAASALETLKSLQCTGKKFAVLGDMLELGKYAAEEHRTIGKKAAECADVLIVVGQRSRSTLEAAKEAGMGLEKAFFYDNSQEAAAALPAMVGIGDIILIKGSQSIRMERVSAALLREPSRASEYLVRQEKEWLDKP